MHTTLFSPPNTLLSSDDYVILELPDQLQSAVMSPDWSGRIAALGRDDPCYLVLDDAIYEMVAFDSTNTHIVLDVTCSFFSDDHEDNVGNRERMQITALCFYSTVITLCPSIAQNVGLLVSQLPVHLPLSGTVPDPCFLTHVMETTPILCPRSILFEHLAALGFVKYSLIQNSDTFPLPQTGQSEQPIARFDLQELALTIARHLSASVSFDPTASNTSTGTGPIAFPLAMSDFAREVVSVLVNVPDSLFYSVIPAMCRSIAGEPQTPHQRARQLESDAFPKIPIYSDVQISPFHVVSHIIYGLIRTDDSLPREMHRGFLVCRFKLQQLYITLHRLDLSSTFWGVFRNEARAVFVSLGLTSLSTLGQDASSAAGPLRELLFGVTALDILTVLHPAPLNSPTCTPVSSCWIDMRGSNWLDCDVAFIERIYLPTDFLRRLVTLFDVCSEWHTMQLLALMVDGHSSRAAVDDLMRAHVRKRGEAIDGRDICSFRSEKRILLEPRIQ